MKRTNIYLGEDDYAALEVIKRVHGIATDAAAVRLAIRQVARALVKEETTAIRTPEKGD